MTSAHWPQSPRPTLMERRCWVTYTASYLPLWGVEDEPASELGTSAQHSKSTPWPGCGGTHRASIQPIRRGRRWAPPAGNGHLTKLVRLDLLPHLCIASPHTGAVTHGLCRQACFPRAQARLFLGVTMGTHSSLIRGAVRPAGPRRQLFALRYLLPC